MLRAGWAGAAIGGRLRFDALHVATDGWPGCEVLHSWAGIAIDGRGMLPAGWMGIAIDDRQMCDILPAGLADIAIGVRLRFGA